MIVQMEYLIGEGRLIGQHAGRIIIDPQPLLRRLYGDGAALIGDQPVQRRQRQLRAEGDIRKIDAVKQLFGLRQTGALAEYPRDQLKG